MCSRCHRPPSLCVCRSLPDAPRRTATSVLVLQHPRERRRRSLSTVPLLPLVLERCEVRVGYAFAPEELEAVTTCVARGRQPLLLFPGPDALSLDSGADREAVEDLREGEQLLILIDGTWNEAKQIVRRSPALVRACRQVQFCADSKSIYPTALRKEPDEHCLSTLESCAQTLALLEPVRECGAEARACLEEAMRCMVEGRMNAIASRERAPRFPDKGAEKHKRIREVRQQLFS